MVKNTDNNHDGAYKKIFSHPEMVESLIRDFVPEDWVRELDFSTLKNVNKSFITDEIRSRADDIIWKVRRHDSWVYVYLIIEFQSSVDKWMAVRTMVYTGLLYQDLIASKEVGPGGPAASGVSPGVVQRPWGVDGPAGNFGTHCAHAGQPGPVPAFSQVFSCG